MTFSQTLHLPQANAHGYGAPDMGDPVLMTLYALCVLPIYELGYLEHACEWTSHSVVGRENAKEVIGWNTGARPRRVRKKGSVTEMTKDEDIDIVLVRGMRASSLKEEKYQTTQMRRETDEHEHSTSTTSWHTTATARVPQFILKDMDTGNGKKRVWGP